MDSGVYTYCGHVELVSKPYKDTQPDVDGRNRTVWMFPVRPVPENDVKKPKPFVFKDMDDFRANGKKAEASWAATHTTKRRSSGGTKSSGLVGKTVKHKTYGKGTISKYDGTIITVKFERDIRTFNYELCIEKGFIELV